jgi:hypothetical protein
MFLYSNTIGRGTVNLIIHLDQAKSHENILKNVNGEVSRHAMAGKTFSGAVPVPFDANRGVLYGFLSKKNDSVNQTSHSESKYKWVLFCSYLPSYCSVLVSFNLCISVLITVGRKSSNHKLMFTHGIFLRRKLFLNY